MAAGLGFKTFTTGEVLTAADVNGYLMQGVLVFASEAARDAAITSPQEGQFAYTKDNNSLWYYTGSAWAASGATGDIEGVTAGVGISGGGTSGTVTITNSMATAIDAKGDLVPGTGADTFARLAVGTNGQVLTADSTAATGVAWATPSGGFPAWTSYTPTVTASSGSITTYSASGWYSQSGKTVVAQGRVVISTVGSASGTMIVTLPVTAQTRTNAEWVGSAVEGQSTGYAGWASVLSGATAVNLRNYNFGTFLGSNYITSFTVTYEVA